MSSILARAITAMCTSKLSAVVSTIPLSTSRVTQYESADRSVIGTHSIDDFAGCRRRRKIGGIVHFVEITRRNRSAVRSRSRNDPRGNAVRARSAGDESDGHLTMLSVVRLQPSELEGGRTSPARFDLHPSRSDSVRRRDRRVRVQRVRVKSSKTSTSSADASLTITSSVGLRTPRSTPLTYVRSISARYANSSCDHPRTTRSARRRAPKATRCGGGSIAPRFRYADDESTDYRSHRIPCGEPPPEAAGHAVLTNRCRTPVRHHDHQGEYTCTTASPH